MENRTGKGKEGMIGRPAAVVVLILAFVLFSYSVLLYQYRTSSQGLIVENWMGIPIPANETFSYDFVMIYALRYDPATGWGSMDSNASTWIQKEELPLQTVARWAKDLVTFEVESNASEVIHVTIYGNIVTVSRAGSLDPARDLDVLPGHSWGTHIPVIPREGNVTLSIVADPVQSDQPYVGRLYIRWERIWYEKPFYNHGIAGLLVSTVCPILLLVRHIITLRRGERYEIPLTFDKGFQ